MAKYKLTENGIHNQETGAFTSEDLDNRHWQEYLEWLAEPNTPDPMDVIVPSWDDEGRSLRDVLLTACDWTQLSDSPLDAPTKALWVTYRQELRDLPATYTDYSTVVWPTPPAE